MVNVERTGVRDGFASRFRRSMGNDSCFQMDVDMAEFRYSAGKMYIVAICEYKNWGYLPSSAQRELMIKLAEPHGAKALLVWYNNSKDFQISNYKVFDLSENNYTLGREYDYQGIVAMLRAL